MTLTTVTTAKHDERLHPMAQTMYRFIVRFKRMNAGDSPTRREIAAGIGLPTVSMVQHHLEALETAGLIQLPHRGQARRIRIPGAEWQFDEVSSASSTAAKTNGANKCALHLAPDADALPEEREKMG